MDNYRTSCCKNCSAEMKFDIRDHGAKFICPKCETEHTFGEMVRSEDFEPEGWCFECDNVEHECICDVVSEEVRDYASAADHVRAYERLVEKRVAEKPEFPTYVGTDGQEHGEY